MKLVLTESGLKSQGFLSSIEDAMGKNCTLSAEEIFLVSGLVRLDSFGSEHLRLFARL